MLRALALILCLISSAASAQWGGAANIVNVVNPQVIPINASAGIPAVDDNLAGGNYGLSRGICAEWGHVVPCLNHYSITRASTKYCQTSDGVLFQQLTGIVCYTNQGALIEEARTNLAIQSQTFDNASWTKVSATITADQTTAPDGTTTADKFDPTVNAYASVFQTITASNATAYTYTVYAKALVGTTVTIEARGSTGTVYDYLFDLSAGTATINASAVGSPTGSIAALANGWYRCQVTKTTTNTTPIFIIGQGNNPGTGQTIYLWQADDQLGSFATSPIPTTTVSVTRAADVISLINGADTALRTAQAAFTQTFQGSLGSAISLISKGTTQYIIYLSTTQVQIGDGVSVSTAATIGGAATIASQVKSAFSWNSSALAAVANNGTKTTAAANVLAFNATSYLGNTSAGTKAFNGYFQRLTLSPAFGAFDAATRP